jgi:GT2 family glycosyltransferase
MADDTLTINQVLFVSVVIVTWRRAEAIRACLDHLGKLDPLPDETLVVDASDDDLTAEVVESFPWARRLAFPGGAGHMTTARNAGLLEVSGDLIAFLDDDANVRDGWLEALRGVYANPAVSAAAGRTCDGIPGEEAKGLDEIGRVLPRGRLTGNFGASPDGVESIDHGIGANMSFRRPILAALGGFRDDFAGVGGLREDADMFLRVRAVGGRAVFVPDAVVDHVGAPHARGKRFGHRYTFCGYRNHALLIARNFGLGSATFRGWTSDAARDILMRTEASTRPRRLARVLVALAGLGWGIVISLGKARLGPTSPLRDDETGRRIREHLDVVTSDVARP